MDDAPSPREDPEPGPSLLLVEDDPQLLGMLAEVLAEEGYAVTTARDGQSALHLGLTRPFDAMILDRGLPAIEGLDLLSRLRGAGRDAPALILSARALTADRVEGLDAGAEDYLAKPFDLEELLARVRALLRRAQPTSPVLRLPDDRIFDPAAHEVRSADGERIALTSRESALLEVLVRAPGQVFARETLLRLALPGAEELGVVDTCVHYVRRKVGKGVVETVRGVGYRLGQS